MSELFGFIFESFPRVLYIRIRICQKKDSLISGISHCCGNVLCTKVCYELAGAEVLLSSAPAARGGGGGRRICDQRRRLGLGSGPPWQQLPAARGQMDTPHQLS